MQSSETEDCQGSKTLLGATDSITHTKTVNACQYAAGDG